MADQGYLPSALAGLYSVVAAITVVSIPNLRSLPVEFLHGGLTEQIIGAAFEVHGILGHGFLEKVCQRALQVELRLRGIQAETESKIQVVYKDSIVGDYQADLFVEDAVIVELKVAEEYQPADEAQLLNELKATGIKVGLLINFGRTKVEFKRFAY
jgi:GxxExxY protein